MDSELLKGFYLNDAWVEPLKGDVRLRDRSTHLPPKAMEVLLCLASQPCKLVTREALLKRVWGEGQGSAEALGRAVSDIRHALDDHLVAVEADPVERQQLVDRSGPPGAVEVPCGGV